MNGRRVSGSGWTSSGQEKPEARRVPLRDEAIFLLGADGALERVPRRPYAREDILQALIAQHPDLLAGDQIDPDDPPRWLLVAREARVPDAEDASDRWSADHLLLDQRGRPTF